MKALQKIRLVATILWFTSAAYFVYKYSLHAGYWEHPLYITLFLYLVILLSKKGFNKLNVFIFLFYIAFGMWFAMDLFLILTEGFSVD
ncbi:hypothetical protein QOZ98_000612 [Planomicrobium stackebrandtii]|uniref:Uncharacterized protein n=1 Tax=Planomicrobium stackebrandtii TaxID=253160 RepID=A0ABU0GR03_9BACL|nr:hypothetical protein [Planomicrobium stackebrandtii]